jgi:DNA-binding NarL/FixJ family response regulator
VYGQPLTAGQVAALRLAATGHTSQQIAARLDTTEAGVHRRFAEAAIRLGARSRTHAVVLAIRHGYINLQHLDLERPAA